VAAARFHVTEATPKRLSRKPIAATKSVGGFHPRGLPPGARARCRTAAAPSASRDRDDTLDCPLHQDTHRPNPNDFTLVACTQSAQLASTRAGSNALKKKWYRLLAE
jgi:hypothetical protein